MTMPVNPKPHGHYDRTGYRRRSGVPAHNDWMAVLDRHELLEEIGSLRDILVPGGVQAICLTIGEMASALGLTPQAIYAWRAEGRFPDPTHTAMNATGRPVRVYTLQEADRIMCSYAHHLRTVSDYYRAEHDGLREAFAAIPGVVMRSARTEISGGRIGSRVAFTPVHGPAPALPATTAHRSGLRFLRMVG
jgi:hypothetical protein